MPTVPTEQVARIEARISPELKAMFQTAADIENITRRNGRYRSIDRKEITQVLITTSYFTRSVGG